MDPLSKERLRLVHPLIAGKMRELAARLAEESICIRVVQGLRSWVEQQQLYNQGRGLPGKIVTNCQAGYSWHNFGMAVDVAPFDNVIPDWNASHPAWQRMEAVARNLGFVCGADFRTFPDNPHLQMTGQFPATPDDEVRQIFRDGGCLAVWGASGL